MLLSAEMEIVFAKLLLLGGLKQTMRNTRIFVSQVPVFFRKNSKVFELPLFAIFNYKYSHCFFNTKIFYRDFFG